MKDDSERIERPPKQNVQRRQHRKTAGAGGSAFLQISYKLVYTNGTAILYQTKRSQPTRRRRGGRRRPGPGGTAGHQQPPAEESDVPPPGRGPEAAHDESAAPPSGDIAASTGRCPAPQRSAMTGPARPSPTAAPAAQCPSFGKFGCETTP